MLEEHRQRTKLEYMGSEVFQVTAVYREVDGVPCVMELVQKLDGETLIDPENRDRLMDSITSYHTKLYHDALTDSYNRRYFEDALKDKPAPAGVAVLDLDDFKLINDTNGHQAGDTALRTCVDVVRACIRKSDVLIRYGGDEFLLVLPGTQLSQLRTVYSHQQAIAQSETFLKQFRLPATAMPFTAMAA